MIPWLISVPVYGERYRRNFLSRGLPSLLAALDAAGNPPTRFLIHTDDKWALARYLPSAPVKFLPPPPGANSSLALANAGRIALAEALPGEAILNLNADLVMSREAISVCASHFAEGKLYVTSHTLRTTLAAPPVGATALDLRTFGWFNHHRWVDDCTLRRGYAANPAVVYLRSHFGDVYAHCFSLSPFAVFPSRPITFAGPSMDEFIDCFETSEVHIAQPSEFCLVEPCPPSLPYIRRRLRLSPAQVIRKAPFYSTPMMCWQFGHQIVIRGVPRLSERKVIDEILSKIDQSRLPTRLLPLNEQSGVARLPPSLFKLALSIPGPIRRLVPKAIREEVMKWI